MQKEYLERQHLLLIIKYFGGQDRMEFALKKLALIFFLYNYFKPVFFKASNPPFTCATLLKPNNKRFCC